MRKRVIPCIFLKNGMIIRSEEFKIHKVIGNPINQVKRYSDWAVDEIIYIDIKCGVWLVSSLSHRHNIYIKLYI